MPQTGYLLSTAVTGAVLATIVMAAGRTAERGYSAELARRDRSRFHAALDRPSVWMATFLLLALVFGGGAVLFVSDLVAPATVSALGVALAVGFAVVLGCYFLYGVYAAGRSHDHSSARAAGEAAALFGTLLILAVAGKLVLG